MPRGYANNPKKISCVECGTEFTQAHWSHKYCSKDCKRKTARKPGGAETVERQYALISGNWEKYFGRLCTKAFRRELLSKQDCLDILIAQNHLCALTGVPLTCLLEKGVVCRTNASIDRIDPKGPYTKDNVQIVCVAVNKLRVDMSVEEFKLWCKRVVDYDAV